MLFWGRIENFKIYAEEGWKLFATLDEYLYIIW